MIQLSQVRKSFGTTPAFQPGAGEVLSGLDLTIHTGELVVLLGSNGTGKSTLFRCVLGLIDYEGEIAINGRSPLTEGKAVRASIGYMPQQCGLHLDMTVEETLAFYALLRKHDPECAFGLLDKVKLGSTRAMKVGELSGGMRQRLSYVVAAFSMPKVLILDEPISNLDRESQLFILSHLLELHEQQITILLSTHQKHDILSVADHSFIMSEGRLWDSVTAGAYELEGAMHE